MARYTFQSRPAGLGCWDERISREFTCNFNVVSIPSSGIRVLGLAVYSGESLVAFASFQSRPAGLGCWDELADPNPHGLRKVSIPSSGIRVLGQR